VIPITQQLRALKRQASVNPDAVQELMGFLETNKNQLQEANKRLVQLSAKNHYSKSVAEKAFSPVVQQLSRRYYAQYGDDDTPYGTLFSPGTLKEVVKQWTARFEKDYKAGRFSHLEPRQAIADNGMLVDLAPELNEKNISGKDLYNLQLLAQRFCEGEEWKDLFDRTWETRSDLVQELLGYIQGDHERREFRNMVDALWVRNAKKARR